MDKDTRQKSPRRIFYWVVCLLLLFIGGWWLRHSDRAILWSMGLNPAKLTAHRVQGKDGYMMVYSNETTRVDIVHSLVTRVSVTRFK
jgi:hypothetical protein